MLAVSIVHRPIRQLIVTPLEYNQVAPPGFLVAAKVSTMLFGNSGFAIRLPAFICAIAALLAFAWLAHRALRNEEIVAAICIFALSPMLLMYSAEFKQYSGDVLAAVLLTLTVLKIRASDFHARWVYVTAGAGVIVVFFSDASVVVLAGLGVGLAILAMLERDARAARAAAIIAPAWAFAIGMHQIGAHFRVTAETKVVMHEFWASNFMPLPSSEIAVNHWLRLAFNSLSAEGLGLRPLRSGILLFALAGVLALWRRGRRDIVLLMSGPIAVAVIASAVQAYPLSGRLSMFLLPAMTVFLSAGIGVIASLSGRWRPWIAAVVLVALLNPPGYVLNGTPPKWLREEIRPALSRIRSERQPGDRIYVYWGAVPATEFYAPRYGLGPTEWEAGRILRAEPARYAEDLARYRGARRLWLLFSHSDARERADVLVRVDSIGGRLISDTTGYDRASITRAPLFLYEFPEQQQQQQ